MTWALEGGWSEVMGDLSDDLAPSAQAYRQRHLIQMLAANPFKR